MSLFIVQLITNNSVLFENVHSLNKYQELNKSATSSHCLLQIMFVDFNHSVFQSFQIETLSILGY